MPQVPHGSAPDPGIDPAVCRDLPPGQRPTTDFPTVSAGSPPEIRLHQWSLTITTETGRSRRWNWAAFRALPMRDFVVDLHAGRGWSKLATTWTGVPLPVLFEGLQTRARYAVAHSYGGYAANLPLEDLLEMPTCIAVAYEHRPLAPEHGGPARLLVPHLYLWKSAKWIHRITLSRRDEPGTRERTGRHNYGDPWRQQRLERDSHTCTTSNTPQQASITASTTPLTTGGAPHD